MEPGFIVLPLERITERASQRGQYCIAGTLERHWQLLHVSGKCESMKNHKGKTDKKEVYFLFRNRKKRRRQFEDVFIKGEKTTAEIEVKRETGIGRQHVVSFQGHKEEVSY